MGTEIRCQWPPWQFSEIVGYVDIGMDATDRLTGNIHLMRKYLPKVYPINHYYKYLSPSKKQQIYYCIESDPHKVDWKRNGSYLEGIKLLLDEATKIIKNMCQTRSHKWILQRFPFAFDCIDFVSIASQINPNFPTDVKKKTIF